MNARQKKKQMKYKIMHMKHGDMLLLSFDIDKVYADVAFLYMEQVAKIVPDGCAIGLFPGDTKLLDKDIGYAYLDKCREALSQVNK